MGGRPTLETLDELIADITIDAYGDDEPQTAFLDVFTSEVTTPATAVVLGRPVAVVRFDYCDHRRGIVASCRQGRASQDLAVADLIFAPQSPAAWVQAAYRHWLGLEPHPADIPPGWRPSWL